jgi:hypothetical protein
MSINRAHEAFRDILINTSKITDITSIIVPFQIWRTDNLPAVTYQRVSDEAIARTISDEKPKSYQSRYQLVCWSFDYDQAQKLAAQIKDTLDEKRNKTKDNVFIHRIMIDDISDQPEPPSGGREKAIHGVRVELLIHYE